MKKACLGAANQQSRESSWRTTINSEARNEHRLGVSVINRHDGGRCRRLALLVRELWKVFLVPFLSNRVEAGSAATCVRRVRRRQLHTLACELAVEIPRVGFRRDLRFERWWDPLLYQIRPVDRRKKRVLHYLLGIVDCPTQPFIRVFYQQT